MDVRPTFLRFGLLVLIGFLAAACTSQAEQADAELAPTDSSGASVPVPAPDTPTSTFPTLAPSTPPPADELEPLSLDTLIGARLPGLLVALNEDRQVIVADPAEGFGAVLLSSADATHSQPTWSTDGSRIAWTSFGPNGPQLTISTPDGSEQRVRSTTTPAFYYAWAPDDTAIAALGPHPSGVELFIADTTSQETRQIATAQPFYIDWASPDALVAAVDGRSFLDVATAATETPTERGLAALGRFQAPAAIDSQRTIVALDTLNGNDVVVVEDGQEPITLARATVPVFFSPNPQDGRLAVLTFAASDDFEVISAQTTDTPQLSPSSVVILDVENPGTVVEEIDVVEPLAVSWSPDGQTLAVLTVDGQQLRWVFVRDGSVVLGSAFLPSPEFATSYLPFVDQYDRSSTWWSPDSAAFVFAGTVGTDAGIWVDLVEDDLGAVRVGEGRIAFWSSSP